MGTIPWKQLSALRIHNGLHGYFQSAGKTARMTTSQQIDVQILWLKASSATWICHTIDISHVQFFLSNFIEREASILPSHSVITSSGSRLGPTSYTSPNPAVQFFGKRQNLLYITLTLQWCPFTRKTKAIIMFSQGRSGNFGPYFYQGRNIIFKEMTKSPSEAAFLIKCSSVWYHTRDWAKKSELGPLHFSMLRV